MDRFYVAGSGQQSASKSERYSWIFAREHSGIQIERIASFGNQAETIV
jgi:hypothetical protein